MESLVKFLILAKLLKVLLVMPLFQSISNRCLELSKFKAISTKCWSFNPLISKYFKFQFYYYFINNFNNFSKD
jgi:hypothetical protein